MDFPHYQIDVAQDSKRLWINGADGSCIARFDKRFGLDVHRSATAQMQGEPECLHCMHGPAGRAEWDIFRAQVLEHYAIDVPADAIDFPI